MNLTIDIGNTTAKAAVFDDEGTLIVYRRLEDNKEVAWLLDTYPIEAAIVGSTRWEIDFTPDENILILDHKTPIPIRNLYSTPHTLGMDRLAAAVGAHTLFPDSNVLIVDLGTAITIDIVNADGEYMGGNISAGVSMRLRALFEQTAKLPLIGKEQLLSGNRNVLADNTNDALLLGAINGVTYEIEGYIERCRDKFGDVEVILTGGDASLFEKRIKNTIFADCNVVMVGLNAILDHNKNREL